MSGNNYYRSLLEGRARRLTELIEMAAPNDLICQEVMLLTQAAMPLSPSQFKSWKTHKGSNHNEGNNDFQNLQSATG